MDVNNTGEFLIYVLNTNALTEINRKTQLSSHKMFQAKTYSEKPSKIYPKTDKAK